MTSLFTTQNYGDLLSGTLLQRILQGAVLEMQSKIQPLVADNKPATEEKFKLTGLRVDAEQGHLLLRIQGKPEQLSLLAKSHLVRLFLRYQHQLHQSEGLEVIQTQIHPASLVLTTQIPQTLSRVYQRAHFRVHFPVGVRVEAQVVHNREIFTGYLVDLSYGGCRIALPLQPSLKLSRQLDELLVKITFPNGEGFSLPAEKVTLQPNTEFSKALLGCQFRHDDAAKSKKVMRFILESEREVARLNPGHQRQLAASHLFQSQPHLEHLTHPDIQAVKNPLKLQEVTNQIAGQLLLLREKGCFSTEIMQQTSWHLLRLIKSDRDALYMAISKLEGIHPLLLHHLQVASRFYPLAKKMGFSGHYEHALMASLLMHDVGRILVDGRDVCAFLGELPFAQRKEYKSALLLVVRAIAQLHWVPRSLGEDILVNANERLDGSGFPRGLKGNRLDALARGLAVVKQLHCLTSPEAGSGRMTWLEAYECLKAQPEKFDVTLVDYFVKLNGLYPVGTCIAFEKGYVGCVTQVDREGEPSELELLMNLNNPSEKLEGVKVTSQYAKSMGRITGEYDFRSVKGVAA
ncbi:PilZ domain-containing protein [Marinospirillum sp.]|uniref:PilZ domain-containing protein n=1 Tax=Marinospirillum sp. TaxID=2183934 RepID=UPI00384A60A4